MKKLLLSVLGVLLFVGVSSAQEFKPFKLGLGIGYASPGEGGGGILIDFEPAYRINDAIAVGLRIESAVMAKVSPDGSEAKASGNASYTVNGQYYFSNNTVRPYAGMGVGIFNIASISTDTQSGEVGGGTEIGFYPRVGVDIGHFNINIDYNLISASEGLNTAGEKVDIKNSYIGIRIGGFFFGGRN